jgi:hypothetical protein
MNNQQLKGCVATLDVRLWALKQALDEMPQRTPDVEFQFDRVRRGFEKLARTVEVVTSERP